MLCLVPFSISIAVPLLIKRFLETYVGMYGVEHAIVDGSKRKTGKKKTNLQLLWTKQVIRLYTAEEEGSFGVIPKARKA